MAESKHQLVLRPGITNPRLWHPQRPPQSEWKRIRKIVMERDNWTCAFCRHRALKWMNTHHLEDSGSHDPENLVPACVACHAVLHVGLNLQKGIVEIWECDIPQVEIVKRTREGVRQGLTLADIKANLPLRPGIYSPDSVQYANDLVAKMGNAPRAYLDKPLCAVFVNLKRWQLEEE